VALGSIVAPVLLGGVMSKWTIRYGVALVALGAAGFAATGAKHKTALIPAGFGVVEVGLGLLASRSRVARGVSVLVSAAATAGAMRGVKKLPALLRGEEVERKPAVIAQSVMAGLSAVHTVVALASLFSRR
jgi:hypothetical protein